MWLYGIDRWLTEERVTLPEKLVYGCAAVHDLIVRFRILFRESSAFDMPQTVVLIGGSAIPRFSKERYTEKITPAVSHDAGIK